MARTTVTVVGLLRFSEEGALEYSLALGKPGQERTLWLDAIPGTDSWPGLGVSPKKPQPRATPSFRDKTARDAVHAANEAAEQEWRAAVKAYSQAVHADPKYKSEATGLLDLQNREPQCVMPGFWVYRNKVCRLDSREPEPLRDAATDALLIKHHVLRRERDYARVQREVEALENMEKLEAVTREPIPEPVRLFVWQRDGGKCVKCGLRERLEFDHIIPVVSGGSSTERNVQLLCESCNRSKGSSV